MLYEISVSINLRGHVLHKMKSPHSVSGIEEFDSQHSQIP